MTGEKTKDPEKKAPEAADQPKPAEKKNDPEKKEGETHGKTRADLKNFMSQEGLDDLQKIQKRQQDIDGEQKKLQEDAKTKRSTESWTKNTAESPLLDPRSIINDQVEEKFKEYQSQFEQAGLGDSTNLGILKQVAKDLIYEHYTKTGKDKDVTANYVKNVLGEKLKFLIQTLQDIYDSHKHPFNKPVDVLEAFSKFTDLGFIKNGILQPKQFKDTLIIERADCESMLGSFGKSLGLNLEFKQLEGQKTDILGKKIEPETLFKEKRITLEKRKITLPKDTKDLDTALQTEVAKSLPPIADKETQQKIVDYLIAELKKQNPKPEETFEVSPDGKWTKIDVAAENKTQEKAKEESKQTADAQLADAAKDKPAAAPGGIMGGISGWLKDAMKTLMDVFKDIMGYIKGFSSSSEAGNDLLKEWKNIQPEEKEQITKFMGANKKYFFRFDNINKTLLKNPDEARRVLAAKKSDSKPNESWEDWMGRHLNRQEQDDINNSTTMDAKGVADRLISVNGPGDAPAKPTSNLPQPAVPAESPSPKPAQPNDPAVPDAGPAKPAAQDKPADAPPADQSDQDSPPANP